MNKKESSFMGLVGIEHPLRIGKKLLLEKDLDSVFKSMSPWSPAFAVNPKMWILKMRAPQAKLFEFLKSCISKCEFRYEKVDEKWTNLSLGNIFPPPRRTTPPTPPKYFDLPKKPKIPKFKLPRLSHFHWNQIQQLLDKFHKKTPRNTLSTLL